MTLNTKQLSLKTKLTSPILFKLFCLIKIPMLALTGVRVVELSKISATTSVPFKHLNKNPFKSMYFAVQAMAAELSTASLVMLALEEFDESIAYIVTNCEASFTKKANDKIYFTTVDYELIKSGITKAIASGESVEVKMCTTGKMKNDIAVASFSFTWSFKKRN